jgi:hypothetical protein
MLELAKIESNHMVLQPSRGKGDIVGAVKDKYPDIHVHAIERNLSLADVLSAKGHAVEFGDCLDHRDQYDRVVMNPPFEDGADIVHVQPAYSLLRPGGRLVTVVSERPFFAWTTRALRSGTGWRSWMPKLSAFQTMPLPERTLFGKRRFVSGSSRSPSCTMLSRRTNASKAMI